MADPVEEAGDELTESVQGARVGDELTESVQGARVSDEVTENGQGARVRDKMAESIERLTVIVICFITIFDLLLYGLIVLHILIFVPPCII